MELPTRTLPHNYIAIIKILAMSLCTVSFTAFYLFIHFIFFPLDKPPTLMSLQRKLQRHCEWWPQSHAKGRLNSAAAEDTGAGDLLMPLGDLRHPEALQFWGREGRARSARVGPLVRRYTSW